MASKPKFSKFSIANAQAAYGSMIEADTNAFWYVEEKPLKKMQQEDFVERTLVLLKPDAFERNLVGEIMNIIDQRDLDLIGSKLVHMDEKMVGKHYKNHVHKGFFPELVDFMTSGPSLALVYEGKQACHAVRQLIGEKHPTNSPPGSIRGRYASEYPRNLIHGSDESGEAEYEISLYFNESELFGTHYKHNQKKIEATKAAQLKAQKQEILSKPVVQGQLITYPEQVQKDWMIVDTLAGGHTYKVLGTKKMPGGKYELTICNAVYVDSPELKPVYTVKMVYDDLTFSAQGWKLLLEK